jgi:cold shock CspA family protein
VGELVRQRAKIIKYLPEQLYGFTADEAGFQVFFHIRAFHWGSFPTFPGPIIGEKVDVEYNPETLPNGKAPKARRVHRLNEPVASFGVIEDFNESKGFGFIRTEDGRSHYLHRSEVKGGRLPMPGMEVTFFEGFRQGRTRACYITLNTDGNNNG